MLKIEFNVTGLVLVYSGSAENDPKEQYLLSLMYTDTNKHLQSIQMI